jgi:hypothetical protein
LERPEYIPILKWKECEKKALLGASPELKERLCPCLEIRKLEDNEAFFSDFQHQWGRRSIIDYGSPTGSVAGERFRWLEQGVEQIQRLKLPIVVAVDPLDQSSFSNKHYANIVNQCAELCLRVRICSFEDLNLYQQRMYEFIDRLDNKHFQVLLDLGETPTLKDGEILSLMGLCEFARNAGATMVHLSSGAFPNTLKDIGEGTDRVARRDWLLWQEVSRRCPELALGYSDYGSITPSWTEADLFRKGPYAIRYTIDDQWLIVRGGSDKSVEAAKKLAQLFYLAYGHLAEDKHFSAGDRHLWEKAHNIVQSASQFSGRNAAGHTWESLDHHIAYVLKKQYRCRAYTLPNNHGMLL